MTEVGAEEIDPAGEEGVGVFGLYDAFHKQAYRLRLKDTAELDRAARGQARGLPPPRLGDPRDPGPQGPGRDERRRHRRPPRARVREERRRTRSPWSTTASYDVAFILRPVPVEQVKAVAETDENMPPKSTYFFPKVMTGIVFNPVG